MQLPNDKQIEIQSFVNNVMQYAEPTGLNRFIQVGVCLLLLTISFASGYATGQKPDISDQFVIDEHKLLNYQSSPIEPVVIPQYPAIPEIVVTFEPV